MAVILFRSWRALALRGALGLALGATALIWPHATVRALVLLLGAYVLTDSVVALSALGGGPPGGGRRRGLLLAEGLVGVVVGLVTFLWPALSTAALLFVAAVGAIVSGVLELVAAVWLRHVVGTVALGLAGAASVALGALMVGWPDVAATALAWCLGTYALGFGVAMLALANWVRACDRALRSDASDWPGASPSPR